MGAGAIGRALKVNRALTDLRLDGNKIKDLGATYHNPKTPNPKPLMTLDPKTWNRQDFLAFEDGITPVCKSLDIWRRGGPFFPRNPKS